MFERTLKTLIAVGLVALYWQYIIFPSYATLERERIQLLSIESGLAQCGGDWDRTRLMLANERRFVTGNFSTLEGLAPAFARARDNLTAKFAAARAVASAEWSIVPGPTFVQDGAFVRWPFKLQIVAPFYDALRIFATLELTGQLMRVQSLRLQAAPAAAGAPSPSSGSAPDAAPPCVALTADVELQFLAAGSAPEPQPDAAVAPAANAAMAVPLR